MNAEFFPNGLLDQLDQSKNIRSCSIARVDDKTRMLFTDLRTADRDAFQSALFDQSTGKIPLRTFECAAGAWKFERLFFRTLAHIFVHGGTNCIRVARL